MFYATSQPQRKYLPASVASYDELKRILDANNSALSIVDYTDEMHVIDRRNRFVMSYQFESDDE